MEKGIQLITKEKKAPIISGLIVMIIFLIVTLFIEARILVATFFFVIFIGFYLIGKHDYSKEFQKTLLYTQGIELTKGDSNPSEFIAYKELEVN